MEISLQRQVVRQRCAACAIDFTVVRGPVFCDGIPLGIYVVALHGHGPSGRLAHLAIALVEPADLEPKSIATAIDIRATHEHFTFSVIEWEFSPWAGEQYLGQLLAREEVLNGPHKAEFFEIAEHVVNDLAEVREYLEGIDP